MRLHLLVAVLVLTAACSGGTSPEAEYVSTVGDTADTINQEPLVLQPAPGPEPRFDVSSYGRRVPLLPSDSIDTLARFLDSSQLRFDRSEPTLYVGQVEELAMDLILLPTTDMGYSICTAEWENSGWGCGGFGATSYGPATSGSPPPYVTVFVPLATSVVVVSTSSGEMWQRPVGGWSLFPVPYGGQMAADAYDDDGNLIDHWDFDS